MEISNRHGQQHWVVLQLVGHAGAVLSHCKRPVCYEMLHRNLGLDGRLTVKCILKKVCDGVDWMRLAQDRFLWRAVANTVVNL
jgi:hypothetical protein